MKNRLNEREKNILSLYLKGLTTREIGRTLGVSHVMVIKVEKRIIEKFEETKEKTV